MARRFEPLKREDPEWFFFDWSSFLVPEWIGGFSYDVGDLVQPSSGKSRGLYYECIKAGLSPSDEPHWARSLDLEFDDGGSLRWKAVDPTGVTLSALSGESFSVSPSGIVIVGSPALDGLISSVRLNAIDATVGVTYTITASISDANGEDHFQEGRFKVID